MILPKTLSRKNGKFYQVECKSTNCLDESFTSITPSCIGDGPDNSCPVLPHFEQLTSFTLNTGLLLDTNHDVFGVCRDRHHAKFYSQGSLFILWDERSRVDTRRGRKDPKTLSKIILPACNKSQSILIKIFIAKNEHICTEKEH